MYSSGLYDLFFDPREVVLVTELCDMPLDMYFVKKCPAMEFRTDLMEQASLGLLHLHSQKPPIVHRDIKPQNLLLKKSGRNVVVKIADFGFARPVGESRLKTFCGTLTYIAPDVLPDVNTDMVSYTIECDIFSLGLVFQAMVLFRRGDQQIKPKLGALHSDK